MADVKAKFLSTILGLAIGDALGYPTEFLASEQITRKYGPEGITDFEPSLFHPLGTYSDDIQMTLVLAQALISHGNSDLESLMEEVARQFVAWTQSPDNNRGPGSTCMAACSNLAQEIHWSKSGILGSKGCGSAMRSAPVGLFYHGDMDKIVEVGRATSIITHGHPCAIAGSIATAYLVSMALDQVQPEEMFHRLCEVVQDISPDFVAKIKEVPNVFSFNPKEALQVLGDGWVAEETIACALYCFWRTSEDYVKTVLTGASANGDSDSIACIAGAISRAYNGLEAIPTKSLSKKARKSTL